MQDSKDKHDEYDFNHIMFRRKFRMKELIGISVFAIIIMNKVFEDIENDKRDERREEDMTGKMLMRITEVKHSFLL